MPTQPSMDFILLIWLVLTLVGLSLAFRTIKASKATPKDRLRQKYQRFGQHKVHKRMARIAHNSPGCAGAWHQLLTLVQFNVDTAERLVAYQKKRHPNKSDRWCIEKALWDLKRDRS